MGNQSLLFGIIGFLLGGLVVSLAAITFDKADLKTSSSTGTTQSQNDTATMPMGDMVASLQPKTGDQFDKAFLSEMIAHHEAAIAMSKLSATNAKHDELKRLSDSIAASQEKEVIQMRQWQIDWGYVKPGSGMDMMSDDGGHMMSR